jgi:radical SAM protein with 4Fe4S-binding SPASM domain
MRERRVPLSAIAANESPCATNAEFGDIAWVDEFIARVRPYIFVRTEDNILIKRPNQAVKINRTGALILKSLLEGMPILTLAKKLGNDRSKITECVRYIITVKQHLEGTLDPLGYNPALSHEPFEMNFSRYPVLSEIAITSRCNLACNFCYAGCNCSRKKQHAAGEMTPKEIMTIISRIYSQAKVPSVSFTGGEPTLNPHLHEFIAYAKKTGMRVNLITNGTLIDEPFARKLAKAGLDSAQVSLEAAEPSLHDTIAGVCGAFEKSVAAVRFLRSCGIATHTNTTVTRMNMDACVALPGFVKETLGCDKFSMNVMIPVGNGAGDDSLKVTYEAIGPFIEAMIARSRDAGIEFMWYSPVPLCMFNTIAHGLGNKGCAACDGLISIAPNGDVLPCASCADSVGNLLADDFETIWQSPKATRYRTKGFAHEVCKSCDDFAVCNGACPLYWQDRGFGELERRTGARKTIPGRATA